MAPCYLCRMQAALLDTERLSFTEAGAARAQHLVAASGKENAAVRVFIKSGGCSGYQYGMSIDDRRLEGDIEFEDHGVRLVVDPRSYPLLKGSHVDYVENMMGGGFAVKNPNASSECGCGHSFRTDGATAPTGEGSSSCSS